jgi:hypothetical protein
VFPGVPETEARRRFDRWGGVPRYVLQLAGDARSDGDLDLALESADPVVWMRSIARASLKGDMPHRVFHLLPAAPDYRLFTVACASPYVAVQLVDAAVQHLLAFLETSRHSGLWAAARGMLFEQWAHGRLCAGVTVRARRLGGGDAAPDERWHLPPLAAAVPAPASLPDALGALQPGQYAQPRRHDEPALDAAACCAVRPGGGTEVLLLQMTVTGDHPLRYDAVERALAAARPRDARVVFVVPPDLYDAFAPQRYVNRDGTLHKTPVAAAQWVLELPLAGEVRSPAEAAALTAAAGCPRTTARGVADGGGAGAGAAEAVIGSPPQRAACTCGVMRAGDHALSASWPVVRARQRAPAFTALAAALHRGRRGSGNSRAGGTQSAAAAIPAGAHCAARAGHRWRTASVPVAPAAFR